VSATANQLVFFGVALRSNKRENRVAIWRCDRHSTATGFIALIHDKSEPKLIHVEPQTSVLIADEDVDTENAKVRVLPIYPKTVRVYPILRGRAGHRHDYKSEWRALGGHYGRSC
jgi:hypothetical protein